MERATPNRSPTSLVVYSPEEQQPPGAIDIDPGRLYSEVSGPVALCREVLFLGCGPGVADEQTAHDRLLRSVESVRLDPELKRDLLLLAAADNTSVSQVIRTAIGTYLQAG